MMWLIESKSLVYKSLYHYNLILLVSSVASPQPKIERYTGRGEKERKIKT